MMYVEHRVRAPSGSAWLMTAIGVVSAGELAFEAHNNHLAVFFGRPFTQSELALMISLLAVVATINAIWLLAIYLRPGKLIIHHETRELKRIRYRFFKPTVISAPCLNWQAKVLFFSPTEQRQGRFKRLELTSPSTREVILFGDIATGPELYRQLEALRSDMGKFEVRVERASLYPNH